ncbi:MAG TPA: hypothetical protein VJZ26_15080 [Blastocatellia bacterium]|nr:hypothetical protein [Blastocatellia bacterium]
MGRARRTSKVLEKAQLRSAGIKSIDPVLDLGNGLTAPSFDTTISDVQTKLTDYNQALASIDEKYNALIAAEKSLGDVSERMLAGVAARFGKDSAQYEQAGGVRKSERKAPARRDKTTPSAP